MIRRTFLQHSPAASGALFARGAFAATPPKSPDLPPSGVISSDEIAQARFPSGWLPLRRPG